MWISKRISRQLALYKHFYGGQACELLLRKLQKKKKKEVAAVDPDERSDK